MSFDIRRLDNLDYDDIEPIFDEYIRGAIEAFADSPEGEAYAETHDELGGWIGTFIEMAYMYGEFKLPKMTKGDVQIVMENILPRKLTLMNPSEANDAIPELVAFWEFLKREYTLRSAGAIAKYLKSIESQFPQMMSDPGRGGFAKQFFMAGQAAGFDLTTEEGVQAYQEEHNRAIQETGVNPFVSDAASQGNGNSPTALPFPPEMLEMMSGKQLPENINPDDLKKLLSVIGAIASGDTESVQAPPDDNELWGEVRAKQMDASLAEALSDEAIALLTEQTLTETEPGTILHDFQALLDFVGNKGIPVSSKLQQFPAKAIIAFNDQLANPIQVDLKRPVQKSYPPVHGLYMLLRATGLGQLTSSGKKQVMRLNAEVLDSWNQLNLTEKYFTLLEAWLIRSHGEMLGNDRTGGMNEGSRCLQYWRMDKKTQTYKTYTDQDHLNYFPEFHNLALMELFGFVQLTSGKPDAGKGWRVKKVQWLPFGDAMMQAVRNAYVQNGMFWESEHDPTVPFGELHPMVHPYFPEWDNSLEWPQQEFRPGLHTFKVYLGKAWRRIEISGQATLFNLSRLILESVDFDMDHLDRFTYKGLNGRTVEISHPWSEFPPFSDEVLIGDVPIAEGAMMHYVFDFGDWWEFDIQLESVQSGQNQASPGRIIEAHGDAPPQYPDFEDDF
jgi:hypothetical protein